jgi:general secretion pathway protein A
VSDFEQVYKALGFSRAPFSISPDTSFFYPGSQHVTAFNHLLFAMRGGTMALLTGEVGLGKSLICRHLLRNVPANVHVALLSNPLMSHTEILASIYKDFTGEAARQPDSMAKTHEQLTELAFHCAKSGESMVVMVDEAQKLSADALEGLRLLSNLETEQRKLISLVLVGQPELEKTLALRAMRPLRERIGVWCRLGPMSRAECASYVRHRMSVSRTSGDVHFSRMALYLLHRSTKGVPRRINLVAERALLLAFGLSQHRIDWFMVRRAIADLRPRSFA